MFYDIKTNIKDDRFLPKKISAGIVDVDHNYIIPQKIVKKPSDMFFWMKSIAYYEYQGFIKYINDGFKEITLPKAAENPSLTVQAIVNLLEKIHDFQDEISLDDNTIKGFTKFHQLLHLHALDLLKKVVPKKLHRSIPEITHYLLESFGNQNTETYGICHEISFIMLLCCFFKIGILQDDDRLKIPSVILIKYLQTCRKLQEKFSLTPEESLGFWGLDDFHFVPFIWGSAQLINHDQINPDSFLLKEIAKILGDDFLFMDCIKHIFERHEGTLAEHHSLLWSISGLDTWLLVNEGLIRMYNIDILSQFRFVKHFLFGSLMSLKSARN